MAFEELSARWVAVVTGGWAGRMRARRTQMASEIQALERELAAFDDAEALQARHTAATENGARLEQALATAEAAREAAEMRLRVALRARIKTAAPACHRVVAAREVAEARAVLAGLERQFAEVGLSLRDATVAVAETRLRSLNSGPLDSLRRHLQERLDTDARELTEHPKRVKQLAEKRKQYAGEEAAIRTQIGQLELQHGVDAKVLARLRELSAAQLDAVRVDLVEPLLVDAEIEKAYNLPTAALTERG